jgi:hypothetical protein
MVLFSFSSVQAWWNPSYGYRYPIIANSIEEYPLSVNDTFGISNEIIWSYIGNDSYVYCENSGCSSGAIAIADETQQKYWEKESSKTGNSPTSVWSNSGIVLHFTNDYNDSSANNYKGTLTGSFDYTPGLFGEALNSTDGSGDYIDFGDKTDVEIMGNWALQSWINLRSIGGGSDNYIASDDEIIGGVYDYGWQLSADTVNYLRFSINYGSNVNICDGGEFPINKWVLVTVVRLNQTTGNRILMYYNDTIQCNIPENCGVQFNNNAPLKIGTDWSNYPEATFNGAIDEFRIYNRALSLDEIKTDYYNGINKMTRLGTEETLTPTTTTTTAVTTTTTTTIPCNCQELTQRVGTLEQEVNDLKNRTLTIEDMIKSLKNYVNMIICQLLPKGLMKEVKCPVYS